MNKRTCLLRTLPALPAALLLAGSPVSPVGDAEADETVSRIQAFDAAMTGSLTLDLEVRRYRRTAMPEQGTVTLSTRLTRDGESWGMVQTSAYHADPVYHENRPPYTDQDYDGDGNLLVWRDMAVQTFVGPEAAGSRTELELTRVAPGNRVIEVIEGAPSVLLFAPGEHRDFVNFGYLLWAAGRGVAREFEDVLQVQSKPGGPLRVEATGSLGDVHGTWTASFDPDEAYLTREARFTVDGRNEPMVILRTEGARWFGDLVVPERAEISLDGDREEAMQTITFLAASETADRALLQEASSRVLGPYDETTDVTDLRDRSRGPVFTRIE